MTQRLVDGVFADISGSIQLEMTLTCTVYGLASTEAPTLIRYVGQTKRAMTLRYREHLKLAYATDFPVNRWIRKTIESGHAIAVVILETNAAPNVAEIAWIAKLKVDGFRLLNACAGGQGNLDPSQETRMKLSAAKAGIAKSEAHRAKLRAIQTANPSLGFKGGKHTDEAKVRFSRAGSKHSAESRALISANGKGKKFSPERRANIWIGRRRCAAERAAIYAEH